LFCAISDRLHVNAHALVEIEKIEIGDNTMLGMFDDVVSATENDGFRWRWVDCAYSRRKIEY
jgi:sporulation-control protein spo0M